MADTVHLCPGPSCMYCGGVNEPARLRVALATALADRDAHVRGYEDLEQRHAAVVAERDQVRRERDEARVLAEADIRDAFQRCLDVGGVVLAERDALRTEVAELNVANDRSTQSFMRRCLANDALRAENARLRAAIEPTDENVKALAARVAQGDGLMAPREMHLHRVRGVLRAIAARAGKL